MEGDIEYMRYALRLASRAQGITADNPAVGCVIVRNGCILGTGWTQAGGRPHAETQALQAAGDARGAIAYVTLEPCAHTGHTPPCAQALIQAGIAKVVIACGDEDKRVSGKGVRLLRDAGIDVRLGLGETQAYKINAGFFRTIQENLPAISVKIATSVDEKITTGTTQSWITGGLSRSYGHLLRAQHQAIVTGIGTVLADNPMLDCRLPGRAAHSPVRVVLDSNARIPLDSALVQTADVTPVLLACQTIDKVKRQALERLGVHVMMIPHDDRPSFFNAVMHALAAHGWHRVLIEGGQQLTHTALTCRLANTLYWFKAPHSVGEQGLSALPQSTLTQQVINYSLTQTLILDGDTLTRYSI